MRHLFNHEFTHQRQETTIDPEGIPVTTWVTLGTIRGRLRPATVQEAFIAAAMTTTLEYVFYCGPETDIRRGDRVVLGDTKVVIVAVKDPGFAGHHLECQGKTDTRA